MVLVNFKSGANTVKLGTLPAGGIFQYESELGLVLSHSASAGYSLVWNFHYRRTARMPVKSSVTKFAIPEIDVCIPSSANREFRTPGMLSRGDTFMLHGQVGMIMESATPNALATFWNFSTEEVNLLARHSNPYLVKVTSLTAIPQ